jgi:mono/diheme cytochrome c family protein
MRAAGLALVLAVAVAVAGGGARAEAAGKVPAAAAGKVLTALSCTSCHIADAKAPFMYASFDAFRSAPPPEPTGCVKCHLSNAVAAAAPKPAPWLPLSAPMIDRVRRFHAYVQAPPIVTTVSLPDRRGRMVRLARFTACGLERFLTSPVPRRGNARQSMFAVEPGRRRALLDAFAGELEACDAAAPRADAAQVARGRELFGQLACAACHTGVGLGPRLRLGFPLLGRAYFGARVHAGTGTRTAAPVWQRRWEAVKGQLVASLTGLVAMPAFADVSDADVDALYAFVSTDASDLPAAPVAAGASGPVAVDAAIRLPLFREVQAKVFDTTCRHCHSPDARDQGLIESVFGHIEGSAPLELPMSRLGLGPSDTLSRILSPGPGCSDSPLVQRLVARVAEWSGHPLAGAPRGMPLTMPPLSNDVIRLVRVWSAAGCPSDRGDLCAACPDAAHAK